MKKYVELNFFNCEKLQRMSKKHTISQIDDDSGEPFNDPFLVNAGTPNGNLHRIRRAIVLLQQQDMANQAQIRELRIENEKLKSKLKRLQAQAEETEKIERRFDQLSSIILESKFMNGTAISSESDS